MTRIACCALLLAAAAGLAVAPPAAPACGIAPRHGEHVSISEETALIVWDEAAKTEHFIRRATFEGTAADFGFLVPSPNRPDLGEADEAVFGTLAAVTAPKIEYRRVKQPRPPASRDAKSAAGFAGAPAPGGVEVLDRKTVGGFDAVVLRFRRGDPGDDPAAGAAELAGWLKKHDYAFGPTLVAWLKPYVANDWVMTAFRVAGGKPAGPGPQVTRDAPVRMSFRTDRPFYPYREPLADPAAPPRAWAPPRSLRVFLVAAGRFDGTLGSEAWPGRTAWADALPEARRGDVARLARLPAGLPAGPLWLTEFEDPSSPRPGTDEVYFGPSADPAVVHRPPQYVDIAEYTDEPAEGVGQGPVPWPFLLALGAVAGGVLLVMLVVRLVFPGGGRA